MTKEIKINLRKVTRDELEDGLPDIIRFDHARSYLKPEYLKYFRDEHLRELFVKVFWERPDNVTEVLDEAVRNYPRGRFRIEQVRDRILQQYVRDGKLIF